MRWTVVLSVLIVCPCLTASETQRATFSGTVLGHDGRPMKKAGVYVFYSDIWNALEWAEADDHGRFALSTERTGVLLLRFAGVHHQPETVAVWVNSADETTLHVRLGTPDYPEDFGDLVLQSSATSINQASLRRASDGRYEADVETDEAKVAYLISTTHVPITWLTDDTPHYVSTGHYEAPISSESRPRSGKLRIRFDPDSLPRSPASAEIVFEGSPEKAEFSSIVIGTINRERQRRQLRDEAREAGLKPSAIEDALAPSLGEIREAEQRIEAETSSLLRDALLMDYLHLTETSSRFDPRLIEQALTRLGPGSPLWWWQSSVNGWGLATRLGIATGRTARPSAHEGYLLEIVDALPTAEMQARIYSFLFVLLKDIDEARFEFPFLADEAAVRSLSLDAATIGESALERFPEDRWVVSRVRPLIQPNPNLAPGAPVPSFSVPLLAGEGSRLRDSDIEAKVYLLDFWATWCPPCVEKLPALGRLYGEYASRGFEIVSYSFDDREGLVQMFRRAKHAMPWVHSMEPELGFQSEIAKAFEVSVLPKSFLVDEERKIVRVNPSIEDLESYLEGALGDE